MVFIRSVLIILIGFICITSFAKIKPLIIDGEYASIRDYPHAALLIIRYIHTKNELMSAYICGASILSRNILITAAHCLVKNDSAIKKPDRKQIFQQIHAIVGHSNVSTRSEKRVISYKIHEKFEKSPKTFNDIALLKLKHSLHFGATVKNVVLLRKPKYGPARIAGWGLTDASSKGKESTHLKHLKGLEIWSLKKCLKSFGFNITMQIPKDNFCAGYSFGRQGSIYKGDSGSGLIVQENTLIGVASTVGVKLLDLQIYTDVPYHYKWILRTERNLKREHRITDPFAWQGYL